MTEEMESNLGTVEERAQRMGHLPKEEFRGDPDNWVDAETFVRRAEESLPILKGTLKAMERKMAEQEKAMKAQAEQMGSLRNEMVEFVEFSKGAEKRAYEKALRDLKAQQLRAKAEGDMDAFVEATDKIDSMIAEHPVVTGKEKKPAAAEPEGPQSYEAQFQAWMTAEPNVYEDWTKENSWIDENPKMFAYAKQVDEWLHSKHGITKPRSERLKEITKLVKQEFPEYFGNKARRSGSPVEGDTGGPPSGGNGKSFHDLPPDAKAKAIKWCGKDGKGTSGTIPGLTFDQYVNDYFK